MLLTVNNAQVRLTRPEFELLKEKAASEGFVVNEPPTTTEGILQLMLMGLSEADLAALQAFAEARLEQETTSCGG